MILRQLFLDRHPDVFLRVLQDRGKQALFRSQRMRQGAGDVVHGGGTLLEVCGFAERRRSWGFDGHGWARKLAEFALPGQSRRLATTWEQVGSNSSGN